MTGISSFFRFSLTYSNHGTGPGVERMGGVEREKERGVGVIAWRKLSAVIMNNAF